jgi:fluoride exporter
VNGSVALAVFAGGGIGALLRYGFGLFATGLGAAFPWGTLGVNVIGSLLIGVLAQTLPSADEGGAIVRLFLITGVLGGFTTFSAFSLDVIQLAEKGAMMQAALYVAASVALSLGAAVLGWSVGRLF